ncbi:MAG: hypothetical protein E7Z91_00765 [Cyanobacteria bacterium SIG30]|nr:hypothetical protein [Cyanobacteria bacterium SIG30]
MQVTHTSNNIIDLIFDPNEEGLCLLDFVVVEEGNEKFLAQVIELSDDKFDANTNIAKIQIFYSIKGNDEIVEYNGFTPTRTCKISVCNQREIEDFVNTGKKVFEFLVNPKTMLPLKFNLNFFSNNPIILADRMEDFNLLSTNLAHTLSDYKNVVIFDYTGSLNIEDSTRLRAGIDFKLPLNSDTLDSIWEDVMKNATLEVQAVCEDIFNEVKTYVKTLKNKIIPFNLFLKVVLDEYRETPIPELWYLRNKLIKYFEMQIFAQKTEDIEILSTVLRREKITIIDFSHIDVSWHKTFCNFFLTSVQEDVYAFMRLNDTTSSTEIVNKIYGKSKINIIPSTSYGYKKLPAIAENCNNYIFLPTLNPVRNYGPVNASIWGLNPNYAILYGEDTKGFIFKIQNTINLDEEIKNRKKIRKIKLKNLQKYSEKLEASKLEVQEKQQNRIVVEKDDDDLDLTAIQQQINEENLKEEIFATPDEQDIIDATQQVEDIIVEKAENVEVAKDEKQEIPAQFVTAEEFLGEELNETEVVEDIDVSTEATESSSQAGQLINEISSQDDLEKDFQELLAEDDTVEIPEDIYIPNDDEFLGTIGDDELDFYENSEEFENNEIDYEEITQNRQTQMTQSQISLEEFIGEDIEDTEEKLEFYENASQEPQIETVQEEPLEVQAETIDVQEEPAQEVLEVVPEIIQEENQAYDGDIVDFDIGDVNLSIDDVQEEVQETATNNNSYYANASVEEDDDDISLEELARQANEETYAENTYNYDVIDFTKKAVVEEPKVAQVDIQDNQQSMNYNGETFDIIAAPEEPKIFTKPQEKVVSDFKEGEVVKHSKYGIGKVSKVILYSNRSLLQIEFADIGTRLLDPKIANIKHLSEK